MDLKVNSCDLMPFICFAAPILPLAFLMGLRYAKRTTSVGSVRRGDDALSKSGAHLPERCDAPFRRRNVRWVAKFANSTKSSMTDDDFAAWWRDLCQADAAGADSRRANEGLPMTINCIFCKRDRPILAETKLSCAFYDGFPVA